MPDFNYGDVHYIDRFETCGAEQHSGRPAVILSERIWERDKATLVIAYLTTQPREDIPTHVVIHSTGRESTVLCEQITTVDVSRIREYLCTVTPGELAQIERAIFASLGFRYITLITGSNRAFVAEEHDRRLIEDNKILQQDLDDLQQANEALKMENGKLRADKQRMNEELIRQRTAAKIYERVYSDMMAGSPQRKREESPNE